MVAVVTGCHAQSLELTCDNDSCVSPNTLGSETTPIYLQAGTEYVVAVGGYSPTTQVMGSFTLSIRVETPVTNQGGSRTNAPTKSA